MNEIESLESNMGTQLPEEYKIFLNTFNGGSCRNDTITLENKEQVYCDCLYGINLQEALDLTFWQEELKTDLPENCLAIGSDPGGGIFILIKHEGEWQVMYYDHQYSFPDSSDSINTYKIDLNLKQLLCLVDKPFKA